ncbi:MAG: hypothetical protein DWQ31_18770 [Planctomycetota bacterium]|mgnify:CR=1 FL=1|nr:MAG: hypothetical protein DWQ31_18770 [Planctomycetota bacterium]REJ95039.1 MAG: hypothetical protein DWQ35_07240 [Planctomycetota bacterium]REK25262.1 MAG: hypothetical protein DWQ42_11710 [Planctomycetota bacterium]REK40579.1 MAG: hypothetical protein DWQ46_16030 [Planctomycetota bacterium]
MKRFKNLLVGVDLSTADRFVGDDVAPTGQVALDRALELATQNSARVTLQFVLEVSERARYLIEQANNGVLDEAREILERRAEPFRAAGLEVECVVGIGRVWLDLIHRVLRHGHDLVIIGTRRHGSLEQYFLGTTGTKLFRKCPCPVWVVKAHDGNQLRSVLVANDLEPVSDKAMELGCSLADMHQAELHVLHALVQPREAEVLATVVATERPDEDFHGLAKQQIAAQLARISPAAEPHVHVVEGQADAVIVEHLQKYNIDLMVMGTVSRTGIPGLVVGNTAERLLPRINCSLLAIKPDGFVSPIHE